MKKLAGRLKTCGCVDCLSRGLSISQIKWIALLAMTIDHLAAYGFEIPIFGAHFNTFRVIGRIAAPLFFFALTESIRHTRSKERLLLRLYVGAVGTGLFVTVTNALFRNSIGMFRSSNILFDYVYMTLYIILLERLIEGIKTKQWKQEALALLGMGTTCIPHFMAWFLYEIPVRWGISVETVWTLRDLSDSLIRSPLAAEYTILFIIMGILMYFAENKYGKAAVLVLFSLICYLGGKVEFLNNYSVIGTVLGYPQYYMIFAVPFILLYNGEKGKSSKYFFYVYYPLHRYVISVAVYVYSLIM